MEPKTESKNEKIDRQGFLTDIQIDLTYKKMLMDKDYPNGQMVKHRLYMINQDTIVI